MTPDDGVRVVFRKYDGSLHWHAWLRHLGEDEHGVWLGAPTGVTWQRNDQPPITFQHGHVSLFPRDAWWVANFNTEPSDLVIYCDVTDVPVWSGGREVTMVDLDLDVIVVRETGEIRIIDEDEFDEHQVRYGYPPSVIEQARAAADWLAVALAADEPFRTTYRQWLSLVDTP